MVDSVYDNVSKMWFGTKDKMVWIETPDSGADVSPQGSSADQVLLDGGGFVRNSWDSHKRYQFGWPDSSSRELASIMHGYANGTYGRGLIYFQDPMYYDTNVLARRIADPSMAIGYEAPSWLASIVPTTTPTGTNANNLPIATAVYTIPANYVHDPADSVWVPIPEGHQLLLGAFYTTSGNATSAIVVDDGTTKTALAKLAVTSTTVISHAFSGVAGVNIYPGFTGSNTTTGTISVTAVTARIQPIGDVDPEIMNGPWRSGEGHSGCRFVGKPTLFNYTGVNGGQVGLAATLKEVGSWQ